MTVLAFKTMKRTTCKEVSIIHYFLILWRMGIFIVILLSSNFISPATGIIRKTSVIDE